METDVGGSNNADNISIEQFELFLQNSSSRFKREECHSFLPQHPPFSPWKVLIGPSDWEDHDKNKNGGERYRVHNLSNCSSTGLYELGVALQRADSTKKIEKDKIIPVYLGQADNVRTRLQHYGRKGSHLESESLNIDPDDFIQQGNRLFSEIFLKGFSIMYRWAPMKSKQEAEKTEAELLNIYDYAWNKGNNGTRRHNDILKKIDEAISQDAKSLPISRKIRNIYLNKIGAEFNPSKPLLLENGSIIYNNQENNDVFPRIFKFGKSNPRRVTVTFGNNNDNCVDICGVALGRGCVCIKPPLEGKKRCVEHKGLKINGLKSKLIAEDKYVCDNIRKDSLPICGFISENGFVCTSHIVPGRKRCEEHKGKKIKQKSEKSNILSEKTSKICRANLEDGTFCSAEAVIGRERCEEHKGRKIKHQFIIRPENSEPEMEKTEGIGQICGVHLEDDSFCKRAPVEGRKRCLEHKGMRVYSVGYPTTSTYTYADTKASSNMCGAGLGDGSICSMVPVRGRKRCEKHKGMRAMFW